MLLFFRGVVLETKALVSRRVEDKNKVFVVDLRNKY